MILNVGKSKIKIQNDILENCGNEITQIIPCCKILIVTDKNVAKFYLNKVKKSLEKQGYKTNIFIFNAGEISKNIKTIEDIYSILNLNNFSRTDIILGLGGGVVTDIAGFISSTYKRGLNLVHIPTSLLAQIDASIGGKNGVNYGKIKNCIGSFYDPNLILIDPETLKTLPYTEFNFSLSEAIKCACIKDKKLFEILENDNLKNSLEEIIFRSIMVKKILVENDKFDFSLRMLLNFGHTFGHSIEKLYNYKNISHGQAVAIGMNMITKISENLNLTAKGTAKRISEVCKKYSLPIKSDFKLGKILENILYDKKILENNLNLVFLKKIGCGFIYKLSTSEIKEFFNE